MAELHHRLLLEHDYAIINPLQVESTLWRDLPTMPLVPKQVGARPELMPRLLRLQDLSDDAKSGLLQRAQRHEKFSRHPFLSALLMADVDSQGLAAHISLRLIVHTPDGGSAFFRYFDPRVFRHLPWLLRDAQMRLLMGQVLRWTWREAAGDWQQYTRPEATTTLTKLRLNDEQWGSLQRMALLNRTLKKIEQSAHAGHWDTDASRVDVLLLEASQRFGLVAADDRLLYALQAATLHPDIHQHPQIVLRLARSREDQVSYVVACRDLDPTTLRRFVADLTPPSRMLA